MPHLAAVSPAAPEGPCTAWREDTGNLRVLVADAYADAADSLPLFVKLWGQDVCVAPTGRDALEVARGFQPDVALVELALSELDGYQLARRLRGEVLLVALTGLADEVSRRRSSEAGFQLHPVKSVEPQTVQDLLAEFDERAGCPTWRSRPKAVAGFAG
jgi:CheY-like chemotaxis protein